MDIVGQPAEIRFTLTVIRKDTGKVETFDMIGKVLPVEQPQEEKQDVNDALSSRP